MDNLALKEWFYLYQHPITDEISVRSETFYFTGSEWLLPDHQTMLPNMKDGSDFYESREEALDALRRGEWAIGSEE